MVVAAPRPSDPATCGYIARAMMKLSIDFEHPSREWWDAGGQELWEGIIEEAGASSVVLDDDLAALGLADEVDGSVTSAQLGLTKPDPDVFSAAALRNGLMFSEVAYVDSSPANVAAAEILGIRSHLYQGPSGLAEFVTELLT